MSVFKKGEEVVVCNNNLLSYCTKGVVLKTLDKKKLVLVHWLDGAPPLRVKEDNLAKIEIITKYSPVITLCGSKATAGVYETKEEAEEILSRYQYSKDLGVDISFSIEEIKISSGGGVPFTL